VIKRWEECVLGGNEEETRKEKQVTMKRLGEEFTEENIARGWK
jgi:hypothetical protein